MLGTFGRNRGHSGRTNTNTFIFMFIQGDIGTQDLQLKYLKIILMLKELMYFFSSDVVEF